MSDKVPILDPINKIIALMYFPCAPTPEVWIECAFAAAPLAVWSVLSPNLKEEIKWSTGGSWLHNIRILMSDAELAEPTWMAAGVRFLFEVAEWLDLLVWWLFIADVSIEFLADWTSMVWTMSGCLPKPHVKYGHSKTPSSIVFGNTDWQDGPAWEACSGDFGTAFGVVWHFDGDKKVSIGCNATWTDFVDDPVAMDARIIDDTTGKVLKQANFDPEHHDGAKSSVLMLPGHVTPAGGQSIRFQVRCSAPTSLAAIFSDKGNFSVAVSDNVPNRVPGPMDPFGGGL